MAAVVNPAAAVFDRMDAMPAQDQASERAAASQMSPGDQERVVQFVYAVAAPAAAKKKARRR